jgi:hypothetical protein
MDYTVDYIKTGLAHQDRVIDEVTELSKKLTDLSKFIYENKFFLNLDIEEQKRMIRQSVFMELYFGVLCERINNF